MRTRYSKNHFFVFVILFIFSTVYCSDDKLDLHYGSGKGLFLNFYQKYISPIDGRGNCRMYPTCSQYAKIAFETENPVSAYSSTMNRILVCGRDTEYKRSVFVDGEYRYLDLPKNFKLPDLETSLNEKKLPLKYNIADSLIAAGFIDFSLLTRIQSFYECKNDSMRKHISLEFLKTGFQGLDVGSFYVYAIHFEDLFHDDDEYMQKLIVLLSAKLYFHENYEMAIGKLLSSGSEYIDNNLQMKIILFFANLKNFDYFEILNNQDYYRTIMQKYDITIEQIQNLSNLKLKSPGLAKYSGYVIPGSGYIYAERKSTGIASFIVNGLIIFSAYELFSNENYITGGAICLFGSGWYFGSASGSAKAVTEYNTSLKRDEVNFISKEFNIEDIIKSIEY